MSNNKPHIKITPAAMRGLGLSTLSPSAFRSIIILACWSAEWEQVGTMRLDQIGPMLGLSKKRLASFLAEVTADHGRSPGPLATILGDDIVLNPEIIEFGRDGASWSQRDTGKVLARDGRRCRYCGTQCFDDLTYDHVFPRSRGGGDNQRNLVVSCASCNSRKNDRTPEEANMALLPVPGKT